MPAAAQAAAYIQTDTQNLISRTAEIRAPQNIVLAAKNIIQHKSILAGDVRRAVMILIGRYCNIKQGAELRPPCRDHKGANTYFPLKIGDYVEFGENSLTEASSIGSMVSIGRNVQIGKFCIIKDCVRIEDDSVVIPGTVIASFTVYAGNPAVQVAELPESIGSFFVTNAKETYDLFQT